MKETSGNEVNVSLRGIYTGSLGRVSGTINARWCSAGPKNGFSLMIWRTSGPHLRRSV